VSVEPAADFTAVEALELRKVFEAALAALAEVSLLVRDCARADPAADLADLVAVELRRVLEAAEAARLLVRSVFLAMPNSPCHEESFLADSQERNKNNGGVHQLILSFVLVILV